VELHTLVETVPVQTGRDPSAPFTRMTPLLEKCQIKALLVSKYRLESKQVLMVRAKNLVAPSMHRDVSGPTFPNQAVKRKSLE
jgi:hypothetical protein